MRPTDWGGWLYLAATVFHLPPEGLLRLTPAVWGMLVENAVRKQKGKGRRADVVEVKYADQLPAGGGKNELLIINHLEKNFHP